MSELLIVHDIPGRLRLRLPPTAAADGLPAAMLERAGVTGCTWSPRTRSLLLLYRPEAVDTGALTAAVARHTGAEGAIGGHRVESEATSGEPGAALAAGLRGAVQVLDDRVQRASRGSVGLGALLPLALIGWALTEVVRGRTGPLAWSTALWYAHGLYRDYSLPSPRD
jgi:hypothetical protein